MSGIRSSQVWWGRLVEGYSLPSLVFMTVFVPLSFRLINDGDLYWHIATGRWILDHGAVPKADVFSFSVPGQPWVAHEWLAAVLLDLAYDALGWSGVSVLSAAAVGLALALQAAFLRSRLEPLYLVAIISFSFSLIAIHYSARPHVLAIPLGMYWTMRLVEASEKGQSPNLKLLGVMALWANLHGGFVLGILFLLIIGVEAVISASRGRGRRILAERWGIFAVLAIVMCLLTPNGIQGMLHPFHMLGMKTALEMISEWRSPSFSEFTSLEYAILLLVAMGFLSDMRLPLIRCLLLLGLLHLALKHGRNAELLGLYAPLFLAAPIAPHIGVQMRETRLSQFLAHLPSCLDWPRRVSLMAVAGLVVIAVKYTSVAPVHFGGIEAALEAAHQGGLSGRVFNDYDYGGHLIFKSIPVFIDGRADMYGDGFFEEYMKAVTLRNDKLEALLDRYEVQWTLLSKQRPAVALIDHLAGWQRVYENDQAVVHRRKLVGASNHPPALVSTR